jgi:hypothetical protein
MQIPQSNGQAEVLSETNSASPYDYACVRFSLAFAA